MGCTIREVLDGRIPNDTAAQMDSFGMISANQHRFGESGSLLDLGAGTGQSYETLKAILPQHRYVGLDIEGSPEVLNRSREDLEFLTYDGVTMPCETASFDVVFCKQVLEHVRHPDAVIAEVARVIRQGGIFVGSVSQLEPYHSHSIFNWTSYGIVQVFGDHGLEIAELRPGIDGVSLTLRRLLGREKFNSFFHFEGLFNHFIDANARGKPARQANFQKLLVAGHINFLAVKTG